jgi:kynurenine formamidase
VVLIRTGRMRLFEQPRAYMANPPGMGLDAARFLVEDSGAMIVGADNLSFETFPSEVSDDYVPLHTYLAQQGTPIIELVALDELARDKVYEFAFIGGPLKIRGGDAAPLRPVALPVPPGTVWVPTLVGTVFPIHAVDLLSGFPKRHATLRPFISNSTHNE